MKEMLGDIQKVYEEDVKGDRISSQQNCLLEGSRSKTYQPLMSRVKCRKIFWANVYLYEYLFYGFVIAESLENRIKHFAKKRRIELQCVKDDAAEDTSGC